MNREKPVVPRGMSAGAAKRDGHYFRTLVTTTANGMVESALFDGAVTYATPLSFEAHRGAYTHSGELLVTGAGKATLRLVALDDVNVRILADYDGDGAMDETIDSTWAELVPRFESPLP